MVANKGSIFLIIAKFNCSISLNILLWPLQKETSNYESWPDHEHPLAWYIKSSGVT